MSKIHSKINSIKTIALATISIGIIVVIIQTFLVINAIISTQASLEKNTDPLIIQQKNIQDAYNLIKSQTVDSN
jgi:hypothetical protein